MDWPNDLVFSFIQPSRFHSFAGAKRPRFLLVVTPSHVPSESHFLHFYFLYYTLYVYGWEDDRWADGVYIEEVD